MNRIVLASLAACGGPRVEHAVQPRHISVDAGIDVMQIEVDIDITQAVDTSIATVWNTASLEPRGVPVEPESEPIAIAMPRARKPGRRAPCFDKRNVLAAREIAWDLNEFALTLDADHPPTGHYGTCTIKDGELRDMRNRLLAVIYCGVDIRAPGIIDDDGFEVGSSGADVELARADDSVRCTKSRDNQTSCRFARDSDEQRTSYVFDGVPPIADDEVLTGAAARAFVREREVVAITLWQLCH